MEPLTADDCDDNDPGSTITEDADCDGTLTADDCDDNDSGSTIIADADCDTYLTADDCNDNDPFAHPDAGWNEPFRSMKHILTRMVMDMEIQMFSLEPLKWSAIY